MLFIFATVGRSAPLSGSPSGADGQRRLLLTQTGAAGRAGRSRSRLGAQGAENRLRVAARAPRHTAVSALSCQDISISSEDCYIPSARGSFIVSDVSVVAIT